MTPEQKESSYLLQKIDCNCNDCAFMVRDIKKFKQMDKHYKGREKASYREHFGDCTKFNKPVSFIPNTRQVFTQDCFVHRKDI